MSKQAMEMALEALEDSAKQPVGKRTTDAITALREALAKDVPEIGFGNMAEQPAQQEPVIESWMKPHPKCDAACLYQCTKGFQTFPECAATPQAQPKENT